MTFASVGVSEVGMQECAYIVASKLRPAARKERNTTYRHSRVNTPQYVVGEIISTVILLSWAPRKRHKKAARIVHWPGLAASAILHHRGPKRTPPQDREEHVAEDPYQPALDLYPNPDPETGEVWVRTPREHGRLVHGEGMGCVAIAQKIPKSGLWREKSHPVEVAIDLLRHYLGQEDVYLSTQRFRGRRRIAHLLSLGSLYADLDFYRIPELVGRSPLAVLEMALLALEKAAMTEPTLAIGSGRGLYLLWLHGSIPRAALPRWATCQRRLWEVLRPFGADRTAIDAARVLRVVGTVHKEAGVVVESLAPVGEIKSFENLAKEILPLDRAELCDLRVQRALRAARSPSERLHAPPQGFTQAMLWEARLSDLQRLREIRWFGEPIPDFRDRWLFLAGVAMSWLAVPTVLQRELYALARQAGGWTEAHARSKLQAVFRTAHQAARGEGVEYAGVEVDPRYRFRNQTIIELLEITAEEEREMETVISDDERRRRDRQEKKERRREAGAMSREEYEGRAADRRVEARRMAAEGMSRQEIAKALGWSKRHVQRVLNEASSRG
jgi:hypothetical protein